jgi:hypothetical protein
LLVDVCTPSDKNLLKIEVEINIKIQGSTDWSTAHVEWETKGNTSNYRCNCNPARSFQTYLKNVSEINVLVQMRKCKRRPFWENNSLSESTFFYSLSSYYYFFIIAI